MLVLGFLLMASQMNSVARRMPLIVGSSPSILLIAYFAGEFWPRKATAKPKQKAESWKRTTCEPEAATKDALNWYDVRVWGWLLVLFACVYLAGTLPSASACSRLSSTGSPPSRAGAAA